jgi:hypothetical protein
MTEVWPTEWLCPVDGERLRQTRAAFLGDQAGTVTYTHMDDTQHTAPITEREPCQACGS